MRYFYKNLLCKNAQYFFPIILSTFLFCFSINVHAEGSPSSLNSEQGANILSLFPIEHYDQNIATWIKPSDVNYNTPLISEQDQNKLYNQFYQHYFGNKSPWNQDYINSIFKDAGNFENFLKNSLQDFDNTNKPFDKTGYGMNFRAYTAEWIGNIQTNMNLSQFNNTYFDINNRAIAIQNISVRALPTNDPFFYHYTLAGQGYPFDNLQVTVIYAGTPIYVVGKTLDKQFSYVISPDSSGWIETTAIAKANDRFIQQYLKNAQQNPGVGLVAITKTNTPISNAEGNYEFSAYVGSIFPAIEVKNGYQIFFPVKGDNNEARLETSVEDTDHAVKIPFPFTPHHVASMIAPLIGRPYGWGGEGLYNDCSAELKSLFTPFGIWLPRHSSDQVKASNMVDLSALTPEKRINYLIEHGKPYLTIIYIGGHVVLYMGNYTVNGETVPLTYQDVWGLKPTPPTRRAVIGKSVFLPMLLKFPEDPNLSSQAAFEHFQIRDLDVP